MTKHIIDRPRTHDDGPRTRAYAKIEREERPSGQSRQAQKAPRTRGSARMEEFVRIERGERA